MMPPTSSEIKFLDFCYKSLPINASILVAVSGGSDSIALLRLFDRCKETLNLKMFAVVHVNHGLRGSESDGDEQFVRDLAISLNLPFFIKRLSGVDPNGPGIENWARHERYAFFKSVMETSNFNCLVTAHTRDDQAETMLMRLMRGSGIRGLRGILPVREDGVYRPLLKHSKLELEQWLSTLDQPFRYDSSNTDTRFQRNKVRLKVLPFLNQISPDVSAHLASLSERMDYAWKKMLPDIKEWILMFVERESKHLFIVKRDGLTDWDIASESLRTLFEEYGIGVSRLHIEQVFENAQKNGRFLLPGKWLYCTDKSSVIFFKQNVYDHFNHDLVNPGISVFHELNRSFHITKEQLPDLTCLPRDEVTVVIDQDTFNENLVYRTVCEDDTFQPFGRKSSTNLMQFLSRQGIAKPIQQNLGVVADRCNKVVWVPGIRVNDQCKVTKLTRRVIKISMKTLTDNI